MDATSTFKTFLMRGTGSPLAYSKLVDIRNFPAMGEAPEMLDKTTLSDPMRLFIPGIQENGSLTFSTNYTLADYNTLKALEGQELHLSLWLGGTVSGTTVVPTGSNGKFDFTGLLVVTKDGGEVNEVQSMTITVAPTSAIVQSEGVSSMPSVTLNTHGIIIADEESYALEATVVPTGSAVTYTSGSDAVATVAANGLVTGAGAGNTIITASITVDGVSYTDTCTVIVQ